MLRFLFGRSAATTRFRPRVRLEEWPAAVYCIGDVHGRRDLLKNLMERITRDADKIDGNKLLVLLGDYVDRGDNSAGVLDLLLAEPPPRFKRIALCGNHEIMMLSALDHGDVEAWLHLGGDATLRSYGLDPYSLWIGSTNRRRQILHGAIPRDHIALLKELPIMLELPGLCAVHAGLRPGIELDRQSDRDLITIRRDFINASWTDGPMIVHGHTPSPAPVIEGRRICIDTGAYASGTLTALRLTRYGKPVFLSASASMTDP